MGLVSRPGHFPDEETEATEVKQPAQDPQLVSGGAGVQASLGLKYTVVSLLTSVSKATRDLALTLSELSPQEQR